MISKQLPIPMRMSRDDGFTLIETVVAMVIIMIIMLGSSSFITWSLSQDSLARERTIATHVAEKLMEEWAATNDLNSYGFTVAPGAGGTTTKTFTVPELNTTLTLVAKTSVMKAPSPDASANPDLTGTPQPLVRLIRVQWRHQGAAKEVFLTHATMQVGP